MTRPLNELINHENPALPELRELVSRATNTVEWLDVEPSAAAESLVRIQVTTRSFLGTMAYSSGGWRVDHGWIRVLGGSAQHLGRSLATWNGPPEHPRCPMGLLVADDVVGGFFAINGIPNSPGVGKVHYFAPDTLQWESLDVNYSNFLGWLCTGNLAQFYGDQRWEAWRDDVANLNGDQAFFTYPPMFTAEFRTATPTRRPVPIDELWRLYVESNSAG